jgi:DNA-binding winged helix-turn-helix (wHTH) protein
MTQNPSGERWMDMSHRKLAFGLYEADPSSGELRKNGMKLRIQEQPFQILIELLEHPGEVVARDDLRLKLWPADTFVDFDHGLNTAINKLREVLGDSASNPRFVETLARRGYRFIAPVKNIGASPVLTTAQTPAVIDTESSLPPELSPACDSDTGQSEAGETLRVCHSERSEDPLPARRSQSEIAQQNASQFPEPDLPLPSRRTSRSLLAMAQLMYLIFYAVALVNFDQLPMLVGNFLGERVESIVAPLVLVTATVGIALRLYLLTAVAFDYKPLGAKFKRLYLFILPLDQLWALAPFLLVSRIGVGAAFAACAALLYLPFSERTLAKMAYKWPG